MHYSMVCVDSCVSRGRAGQLENGSQANHPILIITNEQVFQHSLKEILERTWTFRQATLAKYWVDNGGVTNG
jgi:hypothetical protein